MVPKGVFRDFSHSGIKTEKNSAKNVICHVFISTKQVAKICTYKKILFQKVKLNIGDF